MSTVKNPLVFGEVLFDCFEDGSRVLGGAPFNVAWHLQAFGQAPLFISRVGDDPMGRQVRETMGRWGLSRAGLQLDSAHPTGEVSVRLQDGQPSFKILPDRAWDHIDGSSLPPASPALIYHGSLGLRGEPSRRALAKLLQRQSAPVFMDVNLRDPWWDRQQVNTMLGQARWVKINDQELETLQSGAADLHGRAAAMLERHQLELILVTRGSEGAFSLDSGGNQHEIHPQGMVDVVDTVGAGDAFASVCILGLLRGWPLPQTLQRAQQFASILVGRRGATLQDRELYESLQQEWGLDTEGRVR